MRVFVAGASGAIGRRLVPKLIEVGHEVTGMTRSEERAGALREAGATAVVRDAFDEPGVTEAVGSARAEVVVHELTAIPQAINPRKMAEQFETNDRLRTEGTRILVAAAHAAGARRMVAQSIAFAYAPVGGAIKDEEAPLNLNAPQQFRRSARAVADLERQVVQAEGLEGVVLRYGNLYGPSTAYAGDGSIAEIVRARRLPLVGRGTGITSFVHVDDAAEATVRAVETAPPGIYNVVDDEPAPAAEWLPAYAEALGAPPPRRVPKLMARLLAGPYAVEAMTQLRGASNAKAERELGWRPRHSSWRRGFSEALG